MYSRQQDIFTYYFACFYCSPPFDIAVQRLTWKLYVAASATLDRIFGEWGFWFPALLNSPNIFCLTRHSLSWFSDKSRTMKLRWKILVEENLAISKNFSYFSPTKISKSVVFPQLKFDWIRLSDSHNYVFQLYNWFSFNWTLAEVGWWFPYESVL